MSLMSSVYCHLDMCGKPCCIKITHANLMVLLITLQCYVILLGPAMDRHCRKFMLIKNPRNKFQFDLELMSGNKLEVITGKELEVMGGNKIDVMIGNVIDVMTGNEIDAMIGNVTDAMIGNVIDVI